MNIARWSVVILGCILFFGIGVKAGQYVEAGGLMPGSSADPLAAKSYVDKAVTEKINQLQSQSEDLQAKINTLQASVEKLEKNSGNTSVVPSDTAPEATPETEKPVDQPAQEEPVVKPTGKTATITATSANIRKGPGTNYEVVAGLLNGKTVPVLKIQDKWLYVDLGNTKGWVHENLVELK